MHFKNLSRVFIRHRICVTIKEKGVFFSWHPCPRRLKSSPRTDGVVFVARWSNFLCELSRHNLLCYLGYLCNLCHGRLMRIEPFKCTLGKYAQEHGTISFPDFFYFPSFLFFKFFRFFEIFLCFRFFQFFVFLLLFRTAAVQGLWPAHLNFEFFSSSFLLSPDRQFSDAPPNQRHRHPHRNGPAWQHCPLPAGRRGNGPSGFGGHPPGGPFTVSGRDKRDGMCIWEGRFQLPMVEL